MGPPPPLSGFPAADGVTTDRKLSRSGLTRPEPYPKRPYSVLSRQGGDRISSPGWVRNGESQPNVGILPAFACHRLLPPPRPSLAATSDPSAYALVRHPPRRKPNACAEATASSVSLPPLSYRGILSGGSPTSAADGLDDAGAPPLRTMTWTKAPGSHVSASKQVASTCAERTKANGSHQRADFGISPLSARPHGDSSGVNSSHQAGTATDVSDVGSLQADRAECPRHPAAVNHTAESKTPPISTTPESSLPRRTIADRNPNDFSILRRDFDAQHLSTHPAHRSFPKDDPRITHVGHQLDTRCHDSLLPKLKRAVFTPYELSILQALWNEGELVGCGRAPSCELDRLSTLRRCLLPSGLASRRGRKTHRPLARTNPQLVSE